MRSSKLIMAVVVMAILSIAGAAYTAHQDEMKVYYLVFLKKGPARNHTPEEGNQIQRAHIAHLEKLFADDKISLAGPLMEEGDIRGIVVYHTPDSSEVRQLAEADPAVKAGRLVVELHPWYAAKGYCLK